jgi:hypothetical protein
MKLKINFKNDNKNIISETILRTVKNKEESIYGKYYTLNCGWFVEFDNHFNRWEITTIKKGERVGRFNKEDIIELK